MKKEEAYEVKKLWEEITNLEGLATDDNFHSLEYLAKRLTEATKMDYPNTASKLHGIAKKARAYIQEKMEALADELTEKLDKI